MVHGCKRPLKAKGFCNPHYMRNRRHGDPEAGYSYADETLPGDVCIVDGCNKGRKKQNWCNAHYLKLLRYGDPMVVINQRSVSADVCWDHYMIGDPPPAGVVWPWAGPVMQNTGYGVMYFANTSKLAHRYSYERFVGPIPPGMVIRHVNDTPIDVNPNNLLVGTHQQNAQDMVDRGRQHRPFTKLSIEKHEQIRALRRHGLTYQAIADQFGISDSFAWTICNRRRGR